MTCADRPTPEARPELAVEPDRAVEIALAEARGATAAVERIRSILSAPEASGPCLPLAVKVALNTALPVNEAIELLAAAVPAPASPPMSRTGRLN